jgi:ATP-dependent DNA helicase RecG
VFFVLIRQRPPKKSLAALSFLHKKHYFWIVQRLLDAKELYINMENNFFATKIEFLKGVGAQRAALLNQELQIYTFGDLLQHYPFRHEDRSQIHNIADITEEMPYVQLKGKIKFMETIGEGHKERLVAYLRDAQGAEVELVWFKGIQWVKKSIQLQQEYIVFGKPSEFNGKFNIAHPELELYNAQAPAKAALQPVYHATEKLKKKNLDSRAIAKLVRQLLDTALPHIRETLSEDLVAAHKLLGKRAAVENIHFPKSLQSLAQAKQRLKFEELFFTQLKLLRQNMGRKISYRGQVFKNTQLLNTFYKEHLEFDLTNAQKRVVKEIYQDLSSGRQMNRLLQGDVGSGKTIVAFIAMLFALGGRAQACLMAPTEILAEQHFRGLKPYADKLGITIDLLTGSSNTSERKLIDEYLRSGDLQVLIGTHALLEDKVQFQNLGLVVIDEQHRFGVEQRAKLWQKNQTLHPHVLVMTATPIPRTLAMTLYGDLDVSVIDELPPGRKPIKTVHRYDSHRLRVFGFIREELQKGRQAYIVYPLIEQSEKLDHLKDLQDGYESICRAFPEYAISIVHGQMKPRDKEFEMQRFLKNETQIMVATTVIEVGVNVPNASMMVIENAERFGLSALHQLRGRVGRGAEQSYCILMTDYKLSREARERIKVMVETNDGFEIANTDLKLRGPGDLTGTQQSGILDLLIADLAKDGDILESARESAQKILAEDPSLALYKNIFIKKHLEEIEKTVGRWARIS